MVPGRLGSRGGITAAVCLLFACVCLAGGCGNRAQHVGRTVIASAPDNGAEVTVDGVMQGKTPVTLEAMPTGKLLIVLRKDGYKRTTRMITVLPNQDQRFVIEMEPMVGYLTIDSKPPAAKVYLDGMEYLGETPVVHKAIPIGKHTYEVRKDKYKPESSTIEVQEDFTYTYMHELDPKEAHLSVFTRPTGARIWINEEPRAETTPAKFELEPGDYTIKFYTKGFLTDEENVVLGPDEEKSMEVALVPGDAPMGMILVPGGKFIMGNNGGAPDERPQREIDVLPFYIDKNEVTNAEFKAVFPNHTFEKGKENYPVCGVSFKRATEYATAVGKRLPTEAEWEKAARGTDKREYPWGMEFNKDLCNCEASGSTGPLRVGKYRLGASPYGCLDMSGNVSEWTSSWYQAYPGNTEITKDYGQVFRVIRGGSYKSDRFGVRCARRHYDRMDADSEDYGFRCAKDVSTQKNDPEK